MQRLMESLGESVMAVAWPFLFGLAILAMIIGRRVGFGEREDSARSAFEG